MRVNQFSDLQPDYPFVVVDGGLATELERRGADLRHDLWSARMILDAPDEVSGVHFDFFQAGCDIATTASYQASRKTLRKLGLSEARSRAVIHDSVKLARVAMERYRTETAAPRRLWVAGSCGSIGASHADGSEFVGGFSESLTKISEYHRWKIDCLVEENADLIAFETIPCCREAEAILRTIEAWPEMRCWISFVGRDENSVGDGTAIAEAFDIVCEHPQVLAYGVNCTAPRFVSQLVRQAPADANRLVVYPNSGENWNASNRAWEDPPEQECETWGDLGSWRDSGATMIGGCCRVTIDDIRALADLRSEQS